MRWTLQRRLLAIVVLTGLTAAITATVGLVSLWRVGVHLESIEESYLPLLTLGPAVARRFDDLNKYLQEATTTQDPKAQVATRVELARLVASLRAAPASVPRADLDRLGHDIDDWYAAALDVSGRLIRGESGEQLVGAISAMQQKRRAVSQEIQATLGLDQTRLHAAFTRARDVQELGTTVVMMVPLALIAAVAALVFGIRRKVARSLGALGEGFERFGRGAFDEPIPATGEDELADAARHANRMAESLRQLDEALRGRQAELERANQELEAFSYSVSHDLRAPLRSIDGFSLAVLEDFGALLPAEGKDYLARVRAAAQRMAELIDDMLRLSRISREPMATRPLDVSAIARTVAGELAATSPEVRAHVEVAEGMTAEGDPKLVRIVLENLLGNAWKFASRASHPQIVVGRSTTPEGDAFFVKDNGAGFDMRYAGKLFSPFQRLHTAAEFPGTGIGLATVQRVILRHGGRVWAEGEPGKGATFYFTLPEGGAR